MAEIPSGTVTVLFPTLKDRHNCYSVSRSLCRASRRAQHTARAAFRTHVGYEIRTEGDSFFVVFQRAGRRGQGPTIRGTAPAGAATCGRRVVQIRVRIGLHTASQIFLDGDFVGLDVHRGRPRSA